MSKHLHSNKSNKNDSSWESVAKWYNNLIFKQTSYYHEKIIIPRITKKLENNPSPRILDLGCGNGVLERKINKNHQYLGIDGSKTLINFAEKYKKSNKHLFKCADITEDLKIQSQHFTHVIMILSLQNVENFDKVFENSSKALVSGGKFIIVINHPYFRIPRQTMWGIDPNKKLQYRRVDLYMSPLKIPVEIYTSQKQKSITWSYHSPLCLYTEALYKHNFLIEHIEEWISDRHSVGKNSKMENRARKEFPMFMCINCIKK